MLTETGWLGFQMHEIEASGRPPNRQTVLSDLIDWLDDHPAAIAGAQILPAQRKPLYR